MVGIEEERERRVLCYYAMPFYDALFLYLSSIKLLLRCTAAQQEASPQALTHVEKLPARRSAAGRRGVGCGVPLDFFDSSLAFKANKEMHSS